MPDETMRFNSDIELQKYLKTVLADDEHELGEEKYFLVKAGIYLIKSEKNWRERTHYL